MHRATQPDVSALLATPRYADVTVDDELLAALEGDVVDDGAELLVPRLSSASRRLRALAALSGSLTDALSPKTAATIVERDALVALEASSAVVVTLGAFPPVLTDGIETSAPAQRLTVVHAIGMPEVVLATIRGAAVESSIPLAVVARIGDPLFMCSPDAISEHGVWGHAMLASGAQAAAVVPVWANGELRGVLGLGWSMRQAFGEDDRAFVTTLGIMCAQALMRADLRAANAHLLELVDELRAAAYP